MAAKTPNESKAVPYYEQVANVLRTQITSALSRMPIRLLPERELCAIHDVSRITISKALDLLEAEGLVQRTPGRGTLTIPEAIDRWKRLRQSRVIHVLMGWENLAAAPSSYYGQIYQGIFSRSEMAGYRVSLQQIRSHRTDAIADPDLPDPRTTLGVIFVGLMNEPTIALCTQADYPVVCVDYWTTNPQADAVVVDCYSEGQEAIELLVSRGHRSLFYLGNTFTIRGPLEKESDAMLLLSGMQRGLDMARLPMLPSGRIRFCGTAPEDALQAATWISSLRPRPTAGFVFNAQVCEQLIGALKDRGLRCPEDISLITKLWQGRPSEITCLRSEARSLGELAVDALLDRAGGRRSIALRLAVPSCLDPGRTVRQVSPPKP